MASQETRQKSSLRRTKYKELLELGSRIGIVKSKSLQRDKFEQRPNYDFPRNLQNRQLKMKVLFKHFVKLQTLPNVQMNLTLRDGFKIVWKTLLKWLWTLKS